MKAAPGHPTRLSELRVPKQDLGPSSEAAFLWTQMLRAFHTLFGSERLVVSPVPKPLICWPKIDQSIVPTRGLLLTSGRRTTASHKEEYGQSNGDRLLILQFGQAAFLYGFFLG